MSSIWFNMISWIGIHLTQWVVSQAESSGNSPVSRDPGTHELTHITLLLSS